MKRILIKLRCVKTEKESIEFINFMENFRILLLLSPLAKDVFHNMHGNVTNLVTKNKLKTRIALKIPEA